MRLICPNCDAEYEVGTEAIPMTGREVVCTACNHNWFATPLPPNDPSSESPAARLRRRALDEAVVNILREEAEREAQARRAEVGAAPQTTPAPQPQPAPVRQHQPAREDPAPHGMTWEDATKDDLPPAFIGPGFTPPPQTPATATEPLPDIAAITSSLHASARGRAEQRRSARRRGFLLGFGLTAGAAAALAALYLLAPVLQDEWPALNPALGDYVAQVDAARSWLDSTLR